MNQEELLELSVQKIGEYARFGSRPGLERIRELLSRLGDPHKNLKVIHVGGTNGKGSVCRYVYCTLQEAGYHCGLYISPYIEEFTERIEFDGERISPEDLYELTEKVTRTADEMVAEGLESPTEFEIITAIAFLYYKEKNADAVILEVGLGGRGDATNVIKTPMAVCIASVSLDHMDYLGNTSAEIAWEKAGILKPGVPLVYASEDPDVIRVLEGKASVVGAPVYHMRKEKIHIREDAEDGGGFDAELEGKTFTGLKTGMPGEHQAMNAFCALQILRLLEQLQGFCIPEKALKTGLREAKQPGRIEVLNTDPTIVLDGSHNADSVKALCDWVHGRFRREDRLLVVTGVLKDKEYEKIAGMLAEIAYDLIVTEPDSPRKLSAGEYSAVLQQKGADPKHVEICRDPQSAAEKALEKMSKKKDENIFYRGLIFTGSLYMIGKVRKTLKRLLNDGGMKYVRK